MIEYLNQNQGAIMALLTLVYVGATLLLVLFALQQAKLTQRSLEQFKEAEERRHRPYVIFDVLVEDTVAYAVLKNISSTPAVKIRIEVSPLLQWSAQETECPEFVRSGFAFLAPGREISEPFSWGKEFYDTYKPADFVFRGQISYEDANGARFTEPFLIDVAYTQAMSKIGKPEVADELKRIREALEKIASHDFAPLVRTIDEKEYPAHRETMRRDRSSASFQTIASAVGAVVPPVPQADASHVQGPNGKSSQ